MSCSRQILPRGRTTPAPGPPRGLGRLGPGLARRGPVTASRCPLRSVLLAVALAVVLPAVAANAAEATQLTINSSITGSGTLSGSGFSCTSPNTNQNVTIGCPSKVYDNTLFGGPIIESWTATPGSTGGWFFAGWSGCPLPNGNTCAFVQLAGAGTASPRAVFADNTAASITTIVPVYSTSVDRTVTFIFDASEPASFQCAVDSAPFGACSSGAGSATYTLPEGAHQFRVKATDFSGNTGGTSATNFRIIDTQIVSGPADFTNVKRPKFTYSSLSGLDFRCSIDSLSLSIPCGPKEATTNRASFTPTADLPDGPHTFRVQAFDGPESDHVVATRSWVVDTTEPETTLDPIVGPPDGVITKLLDATFAFTSNETGAFECRLDAAPFRPCSSPAAFSDLPFGHHQFQVRAVDRAGNKDGTPATRTWEVAAHDDDGDGFNQRIDCNDGDPAIHPGAVDVPDDGIDQDCDGGDAVNLDRDRDGFPRPKDCRDDRPDIHPGAVDIPGDRIDQDCNGHDAKFPTLGIGVFGFFDDSAAYTRVIGLSVTRAPKGVTVKLTCTGPGCPFKTTTRNTRRTTRRLDLLGALKQAKLRRGAVLELRVTKRGYVGVLTRWTIRAPAQTTRTDRCLIPNQKRPARC